MSHQSVRCSIDRSCFVFLDRFRLWPCVPGDGAGQQHALAHRDAPVARDALRPENAGLQHAGPSSMFFLPSFTEFSILCYLSNKNNDLAVFQVFLSHQLINEFSMV